MHAIRNYFLFNNNCLHFKFTFIYIYINVILYDSVFLCTYTEYYYGSFKFYLESPTECRCDLHFTVFFTSYW